MTIALAIALNNTPNITDFDFYNQETSKHLAKRLRDQLRITTFDGLLVSLKHCSYIHELIVSVAK